MSKVNHCALLERFTVINDNRHAFVVVKARDFDFGSHRQAAVGCGHRSFLENLTACGLIAVVPRSVPGGLALHGLGCRLVVCWRIVGRDGLVVAAFARHSFFAAPNGAEDQQD